MVKVRERGGEYRISELASTAVIGQVDHANNRTGLAAIHFAFLQECRDLRGRLADPITTKEGQGGSSDSSKDHANSHTKRQKSHHLEGGILLLVCRSLREIFCV